MPPSLRDELVFYGARDITVPGAPLLRSDVRLLVMFPSLDGAVWTAPILEGTYPLVLFVHGNRTGTELEGLCPPQLDQDYRRWWTALHLLARAGFVVACPDVSNVISADALTTTPVLERVLSYMYEEWEHRSVLRTPARGGKVGIAGHSWGANAGLRQAVSYPADAFAAIAGTWESDFSSSFAALDSPRLIISGTSPDDLLAASTNQPYTDLAPPKYQVALAATGHWAWFRPGEIYPCTGEPPYKCTSGAHILLEVLAAFFTRYLYGDSSIVPYLLEDPGKPPNRQGLELLQGGACAARIRFDTGQNPPGFLGWIAKAFTPNGLPWGSVPWSWRVLGKYVRSDTVRVGTWTGGDPWS